MTASPGITRLEPLGRRGLRVRIHLDVGEPFEVTLESVERARIGVGDKLSPDARRDLLDADADVRVREAALNLLSYRTRTRHELKSRLRQKGFATPRVETCLDRLEGKGLIDDGAVAAAIVRDRLHHRPRGRARLTAELRAKGVDTELALEAIERVFEDEGASDAGLAREAAEAWIVRQGSATRGALGGGHTPQRDKAKRRLYGYLARRGFRGDALAEAVGHAEQLAREAGTG